MGVVATASRALRYSGLVKQLAVRDLKLRYERSVLGFLWALLNPLVMIGVYTFVFSLVLKQGIERFPVFLVPVLIPWNFLARCIGSVSPLIFQSGYLINRAAFPTESIVFGGMAAAFIDFCLEMGIFVVLLVIFGAPIYPGVLLLPVIMLIYLLFVTGVVLIFSVGYVFYRDTQYIATILTTAWFFLTPVFYSTDMVPAGYLSLYNLNPMVHIATLFRSALYTGTWPHSGTLVISILVSVSIFTLGWLLFDRYRQEFPEVL